MSNNTMSEEEKHLLAVFSANFNDGEPIEGRVGSRDMKNVSAIVEFIKDYVAPYVASKQIEARLDELEKLGATVNFNGDPLMVGGLSTVQIERVAELRKQQEEV